MTPAEINALKLEYNATLKIGRKTYKKLVRLCDVCNALNARIQEAEGDRWNGIPIIFGAGYEIDDDRS